MKQFFAISLAVLLLLMNSGVTISSHYCGGKVVKSVVAFGKSDVGCGMKEEPKPCKNNSRNETVKKVPCCANEYLDMDIEKDFTPTAANLSDFDFEFTAVVLAIYANPYFFTPSSKKEYLDYPPPILHHSVQVMFQSFLI